MAVNHSANDDFKKRKGKKRMKEPLKDPVDSMEVFSMPFNAIFSFLLLNWYWFCRRYMFRLSQAFWPRYLVLIEQNELHLPSSSQWPMADELWAAVKSCRSSDWRETGVQYRLYMVQSNLTGTKKLVWKLCLETSQLFNIWIHHKLIWIKAGFAWVMEHINEQLNKPTTCPILPLLPLLFSPPSSSRVNSNHNAWRQGKANPFEAKGKYLSRFAGVVFHVCAFWAEIE